jgi:Domain of unknown function (DUF4359)
VKNLKKSYILIGSLLFLLILMATTNPSKSDYELWAAEQITKEEGALVGWISNPVLSSMTEKSDYIIFSVYRTKLDRTEITTYGAFNHFIWSIEK